MEIFGEYIPAFIQVFLDDFVMYSRKTEHLDHLRMCLEKCQIPKLSLNPTKCAFRVTSGALLGHTMSKEGIIVDLDKVKASFRSAQALQQHNCSNLIKETEPCISSHLPHRNPVNCLCYQSPHFHSSLEGKEWVLLEQPCVSNRL